MGQSRPNRTRRRTRASHTVGTEAETDEFDDSRELQDAARLAAMLCVAGRHFDEAAGTWPWIVGACMVALTSSVAALSPSTSAGATIAVVATGFAGWQGSVLLLHRHRFRAAVQTWPRRRLPSGSAGRSSFEWRLAEHDCHLDPLGRQLLRSTLGRRGGVDHVRTCLDDGDRA